jgi:hypothetical protein
VRNRDRANPVVALADALREAHPTMFGRGEATSVEEADRLYERVAKRLLDIGVALADSNGATGSTGQAGGGVERGHGPGWRFSVERAWNGYVAADTSRDGSWLVVADDPVEAAALLLVELNERLGSDGRSEDERRVSVELVAGDAWLAAHRALCRHDIVRNVSYLESVPNRTGWACGCGLPFAPLPPNEGEA